MTTTDNRPDHAMSHSRHDALPHGGDRRAKTVGPVMTTYSADTPTVSSDGGAWRTGPLTSTVPVPRRPTGVDGDHHDRSGVVGVHTRRQDPTWERVIRRALDVTV